MPCPVHTHPRCALTPPGSWDQVDRHIRRLDDDLHKYEDSLVIGLRAGTLPSHDAPSTSLKSPPGATTSRGAIALGEKDAYVQESDEKSKRRGRGGEAEQKRKRKRRKDDRPKPKDDPPAAVDPPVVEPEPGIELVDLSMPIDPSEPTYCYCEQVSYGEVSFPPRSRGRARLADQRRTDDRL